MCDCCSTAATGVPAFSRRALFKLAGASALGWAFSRVALADPPAAPPKPQNVLSPDAALKRLLEGNARYVAGRTRPDEFVAERAALVTGQNPFAGILGCADSRIAPEFAFDTGRGDLFVCRVAGNFANRESIASFEYAVAVLHVPFILVLGHTNCGAVSSTIKAVKDDAEFPGHIASLVKAIRPAVKAVLEKPGDLLDNATVENVRLNVAKLKSTSPILDAAVEQGRLKVAGAIYDLATGRVRLV